MASRPRSAKKRGWPDGLYERGGYYSWRNPLDGKEMGIGRVSLGEAKAQASEANIAAQGLKTKSRLVDRLTGEADRTLEHLIQLFEAKLKGRELAKNTRAQYRSLLKTGREAFKDVLSVPASKIDTLIIADGLDDVIDDSPSMARGLRALLIDAFDAGIAKGWFKGNPVDVTDSIDVKVKRARLTWPVFQTLYGNLPAGRLKNACALALVTGQARENIASAAFAQVRTIEPPGLPQVECWCIERGKTGALIAIPLDLRLEVFKMSLRDVIKQCRGSGVASRFMVHNTTRAEGKLGGHYPLNTISVDFTAAVTALGIDWGDKTPPTFHELRSLSKRLYRTQGGVNTIDLLGHRSEEMGQLYEDGRGAEYKVVGLK